MRVNRLPLNTSHRNTISIAVYIQVSPAESHFLFRVQWYREKGGFQMVFCSKHVSPPLRWDLLRLMTMHVFLSHPSLLHGMSYFLLFLAIIVSRVVVGWGLCIYIFPSWFILPFIIFSASRIVLIYPRQPAIVLLWAGSSFHGRSDSMNNQVAKCDLSRCTGGRLARHSVQ